MSLTRSQYDAVMRLYDRRQIEDHRIMEERRRKAYAAIPELASIDAGVADAAVRRLRGLFGLEPKETVDAGSPVQSGSAPSIRSRAQGESGALIQAGASPRLDPEDAEAAASPAAMSPEAQKRSLLSRHGFPEDYLDPVWQCPDCRDTGFVGQKQCHCFRQAVVNLFYTQSGLADVLQRENFETFSLDWYPEDLISPATGMSSRKSMEHVLSVCRDFATRYDSQQHPYLLLYGESGRGKTFLSHCIARELMNSAHSVMYYSAKELFDRLADLRFRSGDADRQGTAESASSFDPEYLLTSDLLIIDDLGTELPNDFTKSEFFGMLNGRLSAGKGIIISTNLSPQELSDIYSPRIMSRILENFQLLNLFGRDIRIQKRMADSLRHT